MFTAFAHHIGSRLPIGEIAIQSNAFIVEEEKTEVLLKIDEGYAFLFDFGVISFFNVSHESAQNFLGDVRHSMNLETIAETFEHYDVEIDPDQMDLVSFNKIRITSSTLPVIKIILFNLAQSAAIAYYQGLSDELLSGTKEHTNHMARTGKISLKNKHLMKYIGTTLNIKNAILENLYIFHSPRSVWNDVRLNQLDADLNRELDIQLRYRAVEENLNIVKDNLDVFNDFNQHARSTLLEWIIIILILIEVMDLFIHKFFF
ncbi:MAG: RMD1 family protein [Flavobacteriales bacterium]|nr:RMD1 family protein [Flavobacteriales bacterium]